MAVPLPGEEKEATEQGKSLNSDTVQYTVMPWGGRGAGGRGTGDGGRGTGDGEGSKGRTEETTRHRKCTRTRTRKAKDTHIR